MLNLSTRGDKMNFFKTKKGIIFGVIGIIVIITCTIFIFHKLNTPENKIPAAVYRIHTVQEYKKNGKTHKLDRGYDYVYFGDYKDSNQNQTSNKYIVTTNPFTVTNESTFDELASKEGYLIYKINGNRIELYKRDTLYSVIEIDKLTKDGFKGARNYASYYDDPDPNRSYFTITAVRVNDIETN